MRAFRLLRLIVLAVLLAHPQYDAMAQESRSEMATSDSSASSTWVNFRLNPQGLLYSAWGAAVDFKVHPHWAIGPSFHYFNGSSARNELEVLQYGAAVTAHILGECFSDAWYARIGLSSVFVLFNRDQDLKTYEGTYHAATLRFSAGRSWLIWRGLNAGAGVGFSNSFGPSSFELKSKDGGVLPRPSPVSFSPRPFLEMHLAWAI